MVTLAITGIILPTIFAVYLSIKNHYMTQQALLQNQANARLAIHLLRRAVYGAGYSACFALTTAAKINHRAVMGIDFSAATAIQGYHSAGASWQPSLPATLASKVKLGTDVIKLIGVDFNLLTLKSDMINTNSLTVSTELNLKKSDILVVTDCVQADLFIVDRISYRVDQQTINSNAALSTRYQQNASIGRLQVHTYYIRDTNRKNR